MEKIKPKVLILGSTGMLGHIVYHFLKNQNQFDVYDIVYRNKLTDQSIICDITDEFELRTTIESIKPDYIINCIGVLIKGSNENPSNAIFINAYFPHLLVELANKESAKVIHISTDCVFSGKTGNYSETDFRDADDVYGRSKALGEINNENHLTLRTSIIGPELKTNGEGLFHWFMNQSGEISGFTNAFWGGVTTLELAKSILIAIENNLTGLCHVTNGLKISKYELLKLFKKTWNRNDIEVIAFDGKSIDKSLQLSNGHNFNVSTYEEMLLDQKNWMQAHPNLYKQYD